MEELLLNLLKEYGYIILFIWSIMEGELGLIMAGIMSYTGTMSLSFAIPVAALGGFAGDQIYFFLGRYNRSFILKELKSHRRKFALASILVKKYDWIIIFLQRYMYGLRTIIPMSIGLTKYPFKKFLILNLISAFVWASITILLAYFFGNELLKIIDIMKENKLILIFILGVFLYFLLKTFLNLLNKTKG